MCVLYSYYFFYEDGFGLIDGQQSEQLDKGLGGEWRRVGISQNRLVFLYVLVIIFN